ncbi:MAG: PDZ domain-containing protein, partial [Rikenellaceae bacterium]|jgi:S1-C subfamily serine protease|nr:PDZ domain-containing protein [Rikenellaceae bacterium]
LTPGGAAEAAGIQKGDVLFEINGVEIVDGATLSEQIARYRPNDKVKVSVKRDGQVKQFEVTLRNRAGKTELLTKDTFDAVAALGGQFEEINDRAKEQLKIDSGVAVVGITPGGLLQRLRVRRGFIITQINDTPIRSSADLYKITEKITSIDGVYPDGRQAYYSGWAD